ncbi:MAG: hypothetical protein U0798_16745 [Gemmataceae bacterium]
MKRIGAMLLGAAIGIPAIAQEPTKPKTVPAAKLRSPGNTADEPKKDDKKDDEKKTESRPEKLVALQKEMATERNNLIKEYQEEKELAEKNKIRDKILVDLPKKYAAKYLAIAEENPKDETGFKAIMQVIGSGAGTPAAKKANEMLVAYHVENPMIADSVMAMSRGGSEETTKFLKAVLARNPSRDAKGRAAFALAQQIAGKIEAAKTEKDAIKLEDDAKVYLNQIVKEFADVHLMKIPANAKIEPRLLGKMATRELKSIGNIKNLKPGKPAPEIEGPDMDEKTFKISDYKGKVVMLDFWGHW